MRALVPLVVLGACSSPVVRGGHQSLAGATPTFLHTGFDHGPAVFTDATGKLVEERRYEPFGVAIDARIRSGDTYTTGAPDVLARDLNALGKRTDAVTGWSDHGARWMAPETGRWLSTDPPVDAPDAKFMAAPWGLHPYQYAAQNPISYWDPDGRAPAGGPQCMAGDSMPDDDESQIENGLETAKGILESISVGLETSGDAALHVPGQLMHWHLSVFDAGIGTYHIVKLFQSHDIKEQREHGGATALAGLSIAFPIAGAGITVGHMVFGRDLDYAAGYIGFAGAGVDPLLQEADRRYAAAQLQVANYQLRVATNIFTEATATIARIRQDPAYTTCSAPDPDPVPDTDIDEYDEQQPDEP